MPPRSYWKGYLKLSLVTCPIELVPATTDADRIKFRTLNRATGNPVESRYVDAVTHEPVEDDEQAKGYPHGEGEFVLLEDDELEAVALDSTRTIDIQTFVPNADIGWIWYDSAYYLRPADPVGEEAFAVIRSAMEATDKVGISRLVMGGRERAVMLRAQAGGIVMWTLRFGDEVRAADAVFAGLDDAKPDAKLAGMLATLITTMTAPWDAELVHDPVQASLRKIIAAKKKGKKPAPARDKPVKKGNVISIMDALRKSIDAGKR